MQCLEYENICCTHIKNGACIDQRSEQSAGGTTQDHSGFPYGTYTPSTLISQFKHREKSVERCCL